MTDYLTQNRIAQAARAATLGAVLDAGQRLGLWAVLPDPYAGKPDMEHMATSREVQTSEGNRYRVSIRDGRVSASVAALFTLPSNRGIRMFPSDVTKREEVAPTATVAAEGDPEKAARSLHRRVIVPGAQIAAKLREELAKRVAMRESLQANIDALKAHGFTLSSHGLSDSEYYEAKLWRTGFSAPVRVTASGSLYIERLTVDLVDVAALIGIAK